MIQVPEGLLNSIKDVLLEIDDDSSIKSVRRVSGGCIHHSNLIETTKTKYFLKWNEKALDNMFLTEETGLQLLQATKSVRVPHVFHAANKENNCPAFILMEWIAPQDERRSDFDQSVFGRQLALLHNASSKDNKILKFGLDEDNYIGEIRQFNAWKRSWVEFFRHNRLSPQIEIAKKKGLISGKRGSRFRYILDHLDQLLGEQKRIPTLLHGDLWYGNVISDSKGNPVLLDPAVYYGDREADLAFTELFSGFSQRFYLAYHDHFALEPGYDARKHIYNLYHLLNHLNHFGEMYGQQIEVILNRYTPF